MKNIFVYGTLKKGYGNHRLLEDCEFLRDHIVKGFKLFESGIPYMKRTDNETDLVLGEVYSVNDKSLRSLDSLEGHPTWYRREKVDHIFIGDEANSNDQGVPMEIEGYVYLPSVTCKESPKIDGVYVYGRQKSW